jgi:hypothetical protein
VNTNAESTAPGLESFWETCDADGVAEHPLVRELCFRLDAVQRYRSLIADAEANGNDDALELLSRHYDQQQRIVQRLQTELERMKSLKQD